MFLEEENIKAVRALFEKELEQNQSKYHQIDIERVRTEKWQVQRYLIEANDNVETAHQNLIRTLQWKQQIGVHDIDESIFPTEFYQLYRVEVYGQDHSGHLLLWESYQHQRHFTELETAFRQFVAVTLEKIDRLAGERGFNCMADFNHAGLANIDLGLLRFRVECLTRHYPQAVKRIVIINLPFILKPIMKIIVSFMGQYIRRSVEYCAKEQLKCTIQEHYIPVELTGSRVQRHYPTGTESFRDTYQQLEVRDTFVDYYFDFYREPLQQLQQSIDDDSGDQFGVGLE